MVDISKIDKQKIEKYEEEIWEDFWKKKGYNAPYKSQYYEVSEKNIRLGYFNVIFDCGVAHIANIILEEKARGKGAGHKIIQFIIDEAKNKKCHKIRLETQKNILPNAYHLYTKFGFKEEFTLKNDYLREDWVTLSLYLDEK